MVGELEQRAQAGMLCAQTIAQSWPLRTCNVVDPVLLHVRHMPPPLPPPGIRAQLVQNNPEMAAMLNDPSNLREMAQLASNPVSQSTRGHAPACMRP